MMKRESIKLYKIMGKRSGAALGLVLLLSSLAVFVALNMFLIFSWASSSTGVNRERMGERTVLASLLSAAYRWLEGEINAGRADISVNFNINNDVKLDNLRIFSRNSAENSAYVEIYALSYDCYAIIKNNKHRKLKWLSSDGAKKFPASMSGAFLIRAVHNGGRMLEAVILLKNKKLCLLEETCF